jgi:hypothetical protein
VVSPVAKTDWPAHPSAKIGVKLIAAGAFQAPNLEWKE